MTDIKRGKFRPDAATLSFNASAEERAFVAQSMQTIKAGECDWCQSRNLLVMGVYDDGRVQAFYVCRVLQEIEV